MSAWSTARVALGVLGSEGARAFFDRTADRLAERRRRRSCGSAEALTAEPADTAGLSVPVLNLLATPPAPRLGGVQAQLLHRLDAEAAIRPVALLYGEERGGYRLEVVDGARRRAFALPGEPRRADDLESAAFEEAVSRAARAVGAAAVHVEGIAGLPLGSLLRLAENGWRLVLSLHDFAAFCSRPHLLERTEPPRFCGYCRDLDRCARCLGQADGGRLQAERRATALHLLDSAAAIVCPSDFHARAHRDLFPALPEDRLHVIAPAGGDLELAPDPRPSSPAGRRRHIAYVGSVLPHKGALVFLEVLERLARAPGAPLDRLRFSVYGGGDRAILERLRRSEAAPRIHGYYRAGTLPRLLRNDGVDLALLLSIVPESYGLTLDECAAAGVPALAFDRGALGARLARSRFGLLVPVEGEGENSSGAALVAARLRALADGALSLPTPEPPPARSAERAAREHLDLYRSLGVLSAS